ncbi:hypothetical protein Hanom_Chr09g00775041 [Helianthus anomalus]
MICCGLKIIDLEDEIDDMKMLMMKINDDDDTKMIDSGSGTASVTPFSSNPPLNSLSF